MSTRIIQGDCIDVLRTLPDQSVNCCVTSPPYWGLRDYGIPPSIWGGNPACEHEWGERYEVHDEREAPINGKTRTTDRFYGDESRRFDGNHQKHTAGAFCIRCGAWRGAFGLEPTPALYVEHAVMVFREARRVLRDDGTLWLNLGDSYATGAGKASSPGGGMQGERFKESGPSGYRGAHDISGKHAENASIPNFQPNRMPQEGLKPKDLCEIPSDVVRALRTDGWWLRSRIPWLKRNAMPESTKDRPTTAVEYVFLLSKSERYYYDGEAVKIKAASGNARGSKTPDGWDTAAGGHGSIHRKGREKGKAYSFARETATEGKPGVPDQRRADREDVDYVGQRARRNSDWFFESWQGMLQDEGGDPLALIVNPQPFKEAHFATFPPALIEPCILAGCPAGGVVLDPFGGAGTTGLVADRLQRDAILIELNPDYAAMAEKRIHADGPLFSEVTS